MPAQIISGTETARAIRTELADEVARLKQEHNLVPGLVTVLVGEDPASQSYVAAKNRTAHALGIHSEQVTLPADTAEADLLARIDGYNRDPAIHGILVQLPLPRHINEAKVLFAIDPAKDVDGFHPVNVGKMLLGEPCFLPCTPHGILELLQRAGVQTDGAEVVVVGRSNIVGKPVANLMLQKRAGGNATVTVCHTRTRDMAAHTRRADILIVAAGRAAHRPSKRANNSISTCAACSPSNSPSAAQRSLLFMPPPLLVCRPRSRIPGSVRPPPAHSPGLSRPGIPRG